MRVPFRSRPDAARLRVRRSAAPCARAVVHALEPRLFLTATVSNPVQSGSINQDTRATVDLSQTFSDPAYPGTLTQFQTNVGNFTVELFDQDAPQTVNNFLSYVNSGLYNGTIIHRSVDDTRGTSPFKIIQGGGYLPDGTPIQTFSPVPNEFKDLNLRGTIAMAKVGGDPNSATNQWFINLSNNSGLDDPNNNGGYTVFGQVINGLGVADEINALPTADGSALNPTFGTSLPVLTAPPAGTAPAPTDLVTVSSVSVLPKLTYTATSDDIQLVNPTIAGSTLTLNPAPGRSGFAHVTVTAVDLNGGQASDTFTVTVLPAAYRSADITIGKGHARTVTYRESDGSLGKITLSGPGTAVVHFAGDSLKTTPSKVSGGNVLVMGIDASGTTSASTLNIRGGSVRKPALNIGGISVNGALGYLRLRLAQAMGDVTVVNGVRKIYCDYARGGTWVLGPNSGGHKLSITNTFATDINFVSQAPISKLTTGSWSNSDNVSELFSAPYIGRLVSHGNFTAGLQLTGKGAPGKKAVGYFHTPGAIGGDWKVPSGIRALSVGAVSRDFNGVFTQPLQSIHVKGDFLGQLNAPSLGSLSVGGAMGSANLVLTAPGRDLGTVHVRKGITGSSINAAGSIGSISATFMANTIVYAGIGTLATGATLPTSTAELAAPASIGSITLRPVSGLGFSNSSIAASKLGRLNLGATQTTNGGTTFGVAATSIERFSVRDTSTKRSIVFGPVSSPAQLSAYLTNNNVNLTDLTITLLTAPTA